MDFDMGFKPSTNFRMPPLTIAALKKRIQRTSYVPVDQSGERLPREKYLAGAEYRTSVVPDRPSHSHKPRVEFITLDSPITGRRLYTSMSQLDEESCPDSPKLEIAAALPTTSPIAEHLPPVCITADYNVVEDLQGFEGADDDCEVASLDPDVMTVDISPLFQRSSKGSDYSIRTSYPHTPDNRLHKEPSFTSPLSPQGMAARIDQGAPTKYGTNVFSHL